MSNLGSQRSGMLAAALLASGGAVSRGQEASDDPLRAVVAYLAVGKPVHGLRVPSFEKGKLTAMFRCAELLKLDADNVRLQGFEVQFFGKDGQVETTVQTATAYYHIPKNFLCGDAETTVQARSGFGTKAAGFVLDTKRHLGRLHPPGLVKIPERLGEKSSSPLP